MSLLSLPSHMWHIASLNPNGPRVVILGGTHGDETIGIEVIRQLLKRLGLLDKPSGFFTSDDVSGSLFLGFGNPEAMLRNTRGASNGLDLNRSFSSLELSGAKYPNTRLDACRARELAPLLRSANFLLDLHCTSTPSEPFVCFGDQTPQRRELCDLIPVKYIITDPDRKFTRLDGLCELATTDEYTHRHGGVSLCYETGWSKDVGVADQALAVVLRLLRHVGVISDQFMDKLGDLPKMDLPAEQEVYALAEVIAAKYDGFIYEPGMNIGWRAVTKGQLIGHYPDGEPEYVPINGLNVFPSAIERIKRGKKLTWIARSAQ